MTTRCLVFGAMMASTAALRAAPPLSAVVPADAVAAYFGPGGGPPAVTGDGEGDSPAGGSSRLRNTLEVLSFLADRAARLGLFSELDSCSRMWLDALATLPTIDRHAHAVVLLDIQSIARSDGGHELSELQAAVILDTDGLNKHVEERIQHLLNAYTNTDDSQLSQRTYSGYNAYVLTDRRLPRWATITWGAIDKYFVAALGVGAFEHMASVMAERTALTGKPRRSLAEDRWFMAAFTQIVEHSRNERPSSGIPERSISLFLNVAQLERRSDAALAGKIERVQAALGLNQAERTLWYATRRDRSIEIRGIARREGRNEISVLASGDLLDKLGRTVIPSDAAGFTVLNVDPRTALPATRAAYLAARSPAAQQRSRAFWRDVERRAKVSIDEDIVAHLCGPVVIHNSPRHALGLPLAWTILVPVRGDATAVRTNIGRLLTEAQQMVDAESALRIRHETLTDADPPGGLWYLQYGFAGPGLAVTDRWLVLSFSPQAVRTNIAHVLTVANPGSEPGRATAP